jgi:hypothetical protein
MKELDHELTNALRREDPPAGFAERVLRRVGEPPHAEHRAPIRLKPDPTAERAFTAEKAPLPWHPASAGLLRLKADPTSMGAETTRLPFVQWAAAAALVAVMAGGINYVAEQKERAEGEAAGMRVALALHIAGTKLQLVQTKITQLHEQPDRNSNQ